MRRSLHVWLAALLVCEPVPLFAGALAPDLSTDATTTTYYHTDAVGHVRAETDSIGNIAEERRLSPYGLVIGEDHLTTNAPRVGGTFRSPISGLDNFHTRDFSSVYGRFQSPDTIKDGLHHYAYANNNPYKYIDAVGQQAKRAAYSSSWSVPTDYSDQRSVAVLAQQSAELQAGAAELSVKARVVNLGLTVFYAYQGVRGGFGVFRAWRQARARAAWVAEDAAAAASAADAVALHALSVLDDVPAVVNATRSMAAARGVSSGVQGAYSYAEPIVHISKSQLDKLLTHPATRRMDGDAYMEGIVTGWDKGRLLLGISDDAIQAGIETAEKAGIRAYRVNFKYSDVKGFEWKVAQLGERASDEVASTMSLKEFLISETTGVAAAETTSAASEAAANVIIRIEVTPGL